MGLIIFLVIVFLVILNLPDAREKSFLNGDVIVAHHIGLPETLTITINAPGDYTFSFTSEDATEVIPGTFTASVSDVQLPRIKKIIRDFPMDFKVTISRGSESDTREF